MEATRVFPPERMSVLRRGIAAHRPPLVLLLIVSLVLAGCGVQPSSVVNRSAFDGEELFRGFVFLEGPAALLIPELVDAAEVQRSFAQLPLEEQQNIIAIRHQIIEALKGSDDAYFQEFAQELQSGNPVRVERALVGAFESTQVIGEGLLQEGIEEGIVTPDVCGPTFCVLAVLIAIALAFVNYGAVAHSAVRYLAIHDEIAANSVGTASTPLFVDRSLAIITDRFALQ